MDVQSWLHPRTSFARFSLLSSFCSISPSIIIVPLLELGSAGPIPTTYQPLTRFHQNPPICSPPIHTEQPEEAPAAVARKPTREERAGRRRGLCFWGAVSPRAVTLAIAPSSYPPTTTTTQAPAHTHTHIDLLPLSFPLPFPHNLPGPPPPSSFPKHFLTPSTLIDALSSLLSQVRHREHPANKASSFR